MSIFCRVFWQNYGVQEIGGFISANSIEKLRNHVHRQGIYFGTKFSCIMHNANVCKDRVFPEAQKWSLEVQRDVRMTRG